MATLEKIRTKAGVLIAVLIGFALLAFILGDFLTSGRSLLQGSQTEIANVAGKSVPYTEYQNRVNQKVELYQSQTGRPLDEYSQQQVRAEVWQQLIKDKMLEDGIEHLGLEVSPQELLDLISGDNIDPLVRRLFTDPNTGKVNKAQILGFINNLDRQDERNKNLWLNIERDIKTKRLNQKYDILISKGIYVTKAEVENDHNERNNKFTIEYAVKKYSSIPDEEIKVSEDEIEEYYDKNKHKYEQDASRDVIYVAFDIAASEEDKANDYKLVNEMKEKFAKTTDADQFVKANSDNPMPAKFKLRGETGNAEIDTFVTTAQIGDIYGPYEDNGAYKLAKFLDAKQMPDSVHARHILIRPGEQIKTLEEAESLADSLLSIVKADTSKFADIAVEYSADGGSKAKGGDLGWFEQGLMVKEFNDSCFTIAPNKIIKVKTQFGIHILEVLERSEKSEYVKIAYVDRIMEPSRETRNKIFNEANKFAGENSTIALFDKAAEAQKLTKRMASNLHSADSRIAGLVSPREMVKWAFEAEKGEVSKVFEFGDRYVVGALYRIYEKGIAPIEQVKEDIIPIIKKDKKAEKIIADMGTVSDLNAVADKIGSQIHTAQNMNFAAPALPETGAEPSVLAYASLMKADSGVSKPIKGEEGVYVVVVKSAEKAEGEANYEAEKQRMARSIRSRAIGNMYMQGDYLKALKNKMEIEDKRGKFF